MLLVLISIICSFIICLSEMWVIEQDVSPSATNLRGFWLNGFFSDYTQMSTGYPYWITWTTRDTTFYYMRPMNSFSAVSGNSHFDSNPGYKLAKTSGKSWTRTCDEPNYAMYFAQCHSLSEVECGDFTFGCKQLPSQWKVKTCSWTGWSQYRKNYRVQCNGGNGVLKAVSVQWNYDDARDMNSDMIFKSFCCSIESQPMSISSTYDSSRVITALTSDYKTDGSRNTYPSEYGSPNWYQEGPNTVESTYYISHAHYGVRHWNRICSRNGAFTDISKDVSVGGFSMQCAKLIDDVSMTDCVWTGYFNEFHSTFTKGCGIREDNNIPAIRGISSFYSPSADDFKFKLYCCEFKREVHVPNTVIQIQARTGSSEGDSTTKAITFELCWNNALYQGTLEMNVINTLFTTDDLVQFDSCGNERSIKAFYVGWDWLAISEIGVQDNGVVYKINKFSNDGKTEVDYLGFPSAQPSDYIIIFADNYLTSCSTANGGIGCTAAVYNLTNFEQYRISFTPCASYSASGVSSIGIIVRGTGNNLDKKVLELSSFDELVIGNGNIGDLIHLDIEHEGGADVCIESMTIHDPYKGDQVFGRKYFGDGILLSDNCDGDFKLLSQIQYVPCYAVPFIIKSYDKSVYTSIQIHSCSGTDSGIPAANSHSLSLTIIGMSYTNEYVSTAPFWLQSSVDWAPATSRDYTLALFQNVAKVTLITITNNDVSESLCVDSVLINGKDAFLTNYWIGSPSLDSTHNAVQSIPAVLEWPICHVKLDTTFLAQTPLIGEPESVATAVCVNRNRLVTTDCEISQSFETYEEISWEHDVGYDISSEFTTESNTETSVSISVGAEFSLATEIGSEDAGLKIITGATASYSKEKSRSWSTTKSQTQGHTKMESTTDGRVNGESITIECSGSVSVPPSQQITYSLFIDRAKAEIPTSTIMTLTKCSALLYGDNTDNPDDYIITDPILGRIVVEEATSCYVSFNQAEQANPTAITCIEERELAKNEWGSYVPQCDDADPKKYKQCQCAFGDSLTLPTCGCVDERTGNMLDEYKHKASVVQETDTFKWTDWCLMYCGLRSLGTDHNEMKAIYIPLIDSLPDTAFNASSSGYSYTPPQNARFRNKGWLSAGSDTEPYLLIDLGEEHTIVSVSVLPRRVSSSEQYVKTYSLLYSVDGTTFIEYASILNGPQHGYTGDNENDEAYSFLYPEIKARYLKFIPLTWDPRIAMRVEAYTLRYNETSQSVPETVDNRNIDVYFDKKRNFFEERYDILVSFIGIGVLSILLIAVVYLVNSCISCLEKAQHLHKYESVNQFDESKNV